LKGNNFLSELEKKVIKKKELFKLIKKNNFPKLFFEFLLKIFNFSEANTVERQRSKNKNEQLRFEFSISCSLQ